MLGRCAVGKRRKQSTRPEEPFRFQRGGKLATLPTLHPALHLANIWGSSTFDAAGLV